MILSILSTQRTKDVSLHLSKEINIILKKLLIKNLVLNHIGNLFQKISIKLDLKIAMISTPEMLSLVNILLTMTIKSELSLSLKSKEVVSRVMDWFILSALKDLKEKMEEKLKEDLLFLKILIHLKLYNLLKVSMNFMNLKMLNS